MKRTFPVKARLRLLKGAMLDQLGLRATYVRDFTGTYVLKRKRFPRPRVDTRTCGEDEEGEARIACVAEEPSTTVYQEGEARQVVTPAGYTSGGSKGAQEVRHWSTAGSGPLSLEVHPR